MKSTSCITAMAVVMACPKPDAPDVKPRACQLPEPLRNYLHCPRILWGKEVCTGCRWFLVPKD